MTSVRASVFQTPTPDHLESMADVVISVDDAGVISSIAPADQWQSPVDHHLDPSHRLLPGLVDLHIHAPQWPQLGTGLDLPLERWLFDHTFPLESRFADLAFAEMVWADLVPALLRHGTTTAVYYGSIHLAATTALARACLRFGQRAFVGRVAMDHLDGTPGWYRDPSASAAIEASARSIAEIRALGSELVQPIVTPRFIPACSDATLAGLGALADTTGTLVQTHCSESDWEHQYVIDRFGFSDTMALDRFGLMRPNSVLAHGGLLGDSDFERIVERQAGIAHCPLSNAYFGDAVFPLRRALDAGVNVGLGTDIAGGPEPSLMRTAAQAVTSSRMLESGVDPRRVRDDRGVADQRIDVVNAFWLATRGGAEVLGLPVGLLEVGRPFDAIAVDVGGVGGRLWDDVDDDARLFEKLIRSTSADRISHTWVAGALVSQRPG